MSTLAAYAPGDGLGTLRILDLATQVRLDGHEASRQHAFAIAEGLNAIEGNAVTLVVNGEATKQLVQNGLSIYSVPSASLLDDVSFPVKLWRSITNNFVSVYRLRRLIPQNPHIIYERHSIGSFAGIGLAIIMRVPLVFEVNGIPDEEICIDLGIKNVVVRKLLYGFTRLHLKFARAYVTQSEELREILMARYGLRNVHVVYNGCTPDDQGQKHKLSSPPKICFIGTLDEIHDISKPLSAMSKVEKDFVFSIIGDGRKRKEYEQHFRHDKRFVFTGRLNHDETMRRLAESDLALAMYSTDYPLFKAYGFYLCPLKLLEYVGYRIPSIYFGPTTKLISEIEDSGAIVTTSNSDELASAVGTLLESNDRLCAMSDQASRIREKYTWQSSAMATSRLLREYAGSTEFRPVTAVGER